MHRPQLIVKPSHESTRLLMTYAQHDLLKARLPSPGWTHAGAAPRLCEALSLWLGHPLSVVVFADGSDTSSALGLCDGFGFGIATEHYAVEVIDPARPRLDLGSFRELRRLAARCGR